MTGKQRRYLRSLAHHIPPTLQVGKAGVTEAVVAQADKDLEAHELIKVSVLESCPQTREEVSQKLTERTGAYWVQTIGRAVVLYRRSTQNPRIEIPN